MDIIYVIHHSSALGEFKHEFNDYMQATYWASILERAGVEFYTVHRCVDRPKQYELRF